MLLRHAKTENDAPSGHDQDRRLDDRGRMDAAVIGRWIGQHPPFPDSMLVSTAVRAQQTWEIAWEAMKDCVATATSRISGRTLRRRSDASAADCPHGLRQRSQVLLVVGHNPGMHELALTLTGSGDAAAKKALDANLPTAGLAIFDFASTTGAMWRSVAADLCASPARDC